MRDPRTALALVAAAVAFEPAGVGCIDADNDLTQPARGGPMQAMIRDRIARRPGALYGPEEPACSISARDTRIRALAVRSRAP